jgi:NAD(P)H-dependent FMN reductase
VNAVDYLYSEWNEKPAAFVSYGGQSGGVRAVQMAKQMLTTVKIMPLVEGVAIPMVGEHLDTEKGFIPTAAHGLAAKVTLDELARWSRALKAMRES